MMQNLNTQGSVCSEHDSDNEYTQVGRKRRARMPRPVTQQITPTTNRFEVLENVPARLNAILTPTIINTNTDLDMDTYEQDLTTSPRRTGASTSSRNTPYEDRDYPALPGTSSKERRGRTPPLTGQSQPTPARSSRYCSPQEGKNNTSSASRSQ